MRSLAPFPLRPISATAATAILSRAAPALLQREITPSPRSAARSSRQPWGTFTTGVRGFAPGGR